MPRSLAAPASVFKSRKNDGPTPRRREPRGHTAAGTPWVLRRSRISPSPGTIPTGSNAECLNPAISRNRLCSPPPRKKDWLKMKPIFTGPLFMVIGYGKARASRTARSTSSGPRACMQKFMPLRHRSPA